MVFGICKGNKKIESENAKERENVKTKGKINRKRATGLTIRGGYDQYDQKGFAGTREQCCGAETICFGSSWLLLQHCWYLFAQLLDEKFKFS
jgi:hypothetical protein